MKHPMNFFIHTLANGVRILHQPVSSPVAHLGVFIGSGARDELPGESGLAHFTEHNLFKGTARRKAFHVLNRLESVGGEMNAYTAKEETCYYASFLVSHYTRAFELFADIVFNPAFPEKEIEKEKQVVLDEIQSYTDNPADQILDDFESLLYAGHPMGHNILGSRHSVKSFHRPHLTGFTAKHYRPGNILISSVGDIRSELLLRLAEKYFGTQQAGSRETQRTIPALAPVFEKVIRRKNHQAHCVMGAGAYPAGHPRQYALALLNNLLGGPTMTSRLSMAARERHGLTYMIESGYQACSDTGHLFVYFGTEKNYINKVKGIVYNEMEKLCDSPLGHRQLSQARQQLLGQLAISWESNAGRMLGLGKQLLLTGRVDSFAEIQERTSAITARDVLEAATDILNPANFSSLIFEPYGKP